ncbi:hypothetical protein [Myroides odoratimimus]|uniref:Uncharacterized protein n=1 Tax=Myroides odoratimimus CIP 101113 TaxID=883154 RepID=A0AAV3F3Z1_9FLAO|nr:hypothetical protein [Myroides odoratimimus]EHO13226.1 hypothetical protein HMPREF9715_01381 [Myroides odoratimimus CIP 101113]
MDFIVDTLKGIDQKLLIFILTSFFGLISWFIKGIIDKPLNESRTSFEKILNLRIEILTKVKNRLHYILYFYNHRSVINEKYNGTDKKELIDDTDKEIEKFKLDLQNLLLVDGLSAYLSKNTLESIIKYSIEPISNTKDLEYKKTLKEIDDELNALINKIRSESNFFRVFSESNPFKKIIASCLLILMYLFCFLLLFLILYYLVYLVFIYVIDVNIYLQFILILIFLLLSGFGYNKLLRSK